MAVTKADAAQSLLLHRVLILYLPVPITCSLITAAHTLELVG